MSEKERDEMLGRLYREQRTTAARHSELYMEISRIGGLLAALGTMLQDHHVDVAKGYMDQLSPQIDFARLKNLLAEYESLTQRLAEYQEKLGLQ